VSRGWRGPILAAVVALLAVLPGLVALPPLDRDESRFAEASAQMLETGDFVSPKFQETPRFKKPAGIYWLQAAAVRVFSHVEDRQIWAYRIPSLLGAMMAAAACAWGAAAFARPGSAFLAGALLGSTFLLSTEGAVAATDAVLAGSVTLAMASLGRLYFAARDGPAAGRLAKILFWLAVTLSIAVKGPIGPMIVVLTLAALAIWDRKAGWIRSLGWGWGAILILAVIGPWAMAITVASDGAFWSGAVGGDLASKLAGGDDGHGAPPGFHMLLAPLLMFPATFLLPAAAVIAWRGRSEPAIRFALCWLIPAWLVFEATPTKLAHYPLPLYGAVAWLMARSLAEPADRAPQPIVRGVGAALMMVAAIAFAAIGPIAVGRLNGGVSMPVALAAAALYLAAGAAGAGLLLKDEAVKAALWAGALAILAHGLIAGVVAPSLKPLWLSSRAAKALEAAGASPRQGVVPGPVAVVGYEEPSLVFLLGADTELGDADDGADAIADGRPVIVESRQLPAFRLALARQGLDVQRIGEGAGLDYSNNAHDMLLMFLRDKHKGPP
jgi:4-amino-4-deoxy-L-arabinose transferase-like glycosyltransferase